MPILALVLKIFVLLISTMSLVLALNGFANPTKVAINPTVAYPTGAITTVALLYVLTRLIALF